MAITSRPYTDEGDYGRMRALLRTIYALSGPPVYCTLGDLDWWRFTSGDPAVLRSVHLWVDGDEVVAFAWPGDAQVDLVTHPQHREIESVMLAWAEQRHRTGAAGDTEPQPLNVWSYAGDRARIVLLREHSYERNDIYFSFKARTLDQQLPEPTLPPQFTIGHVRGEVDVEPRVAVHRAAFGPSRMTTDTYRAVMYAPTYRHDLDLVAVAPNGTFAAFCLVWFDEANRIAMFGPVGCYPDFRQRGLTKVLLLEGLRRVQSLGATTAYVNSLHDQIAANRLFESVGLQELDRNYKWTKRL